MLDYLVIGHVTRDVTANGQSIPGGTVNYAARTARAMGCRVSVITSAETDGDLAPLSDAETVRIPAAATTTFKNQYTPSGREQIILSTAAPISTAQIPSDWRKPAIAHIGPVAQECDPELAQSFPAAFVGLTPQGWMRRWDERGRIRRAVWEDAAALLPYADAVVLSEEDAAGQEAMIPRWAASTPVLVITRGDAGCTVYAAGTISHVPGLSVEEVDPTGAGDVFAATFFILMERGLPPVVAARRANCVAARSVTRSGLTGIPTAPEIAHCLDR